MSEYSGYKIKRPHALGAFASVYEATAPDGGAGRFALKIFHPPASTNLRRRYAIEGWLFAAERQRDKAKKDGAVLEVLACGLCPEGAYAVMPWQERSLEPLVATLAAKGDILRALAESLLTALEAWETQTGGSHRKLKPANIFLREAGPLAGMKTQFSDPWFMYGDKTDTSRMPDLSAIGAILAQIVRRREVAAWPIEDAPEWKALGRPGKAWLAYCNYLLNPQPAAGEELTIAEARKRLRAVPKDANPVRNAVLIGTGVVLLMAGGVLAFARFGDPDLMPPQIRTLAETEWVHNPRAYIDKIDVSWPLLCKAWDTWLGDLKSNAPRMLRTEGLFAEGLFVEQADPLRAALVNFSKNSNELLPGTVVPEAKDEKRLGALGDAPPEAVKNRLLIKSVSDQVKATYGRVNNLVLQFETWPRWNELRALLDMFEKRGFTRAAAALRPRVLPARDTVDYKPDVVRTLKLFNDLSLDESGALLLASRWGEMTRLQKEMEDSGDRVQKAIPTLIFARLSDRSSLADFADSLAEPLAELRKHREQFMATTVVRERFLKESALQKETAEVTEADIPRWEQELVMFSRVPAAEDPRLAAELEPVVKRPASAEDLEDDAPTAEPGGLPTLNRADFDKEFAGLTTNLGDLRHQEIVRRDLPEIGGKTNKLADLFRQLGQRLETTLVLLKPDTWLAKVQRPYEQVYPEAKLTETKQRWDTWRQTALNGVTAASLEGTANRARFRALRAQVRQVREWLDGLEGSDGLGALAVPDLAAASPDTAPALRDLEKVRREAAAAAAAAAVEWRAAVPVTPWASASAAVRASLEAHKQWLADLPAFSVDLDQLGTLLGGGFSWNEGVSEVMEKLARHLGLDAVTGRPAEWNNEAKLLQKLTGSNDRAELVAGAQSGGLSRKITAWRRLGTLAGWPANVDDLDIDGAVVAALKEIVGRDVKDETRRGIVLAELTRETRVRWNRAARNSASDEKQISAVFERMERYGINEADLEDPARYDLNLWRLKRSDWSEVDLAPLRARRDAFVTAVRAISGVPDAAAKFAKALDEIPLNVEPNRKPTPSPRTAGWSEDLIDDGLGLVATWKNGGKTVKLEFTVVQPKDESIPPFYLAKRDLAAGEFINLMAARREDADAVLKEMPAWAQTGKQIPFDQPMAWWRNPDTDRLEISPKWINNPTAAVNGLFAENYPALKQAGDEKPAARSPLQQIPPGAAKIFLERVLGARLPSVKEWEALMMTVPPPATGLFRGESFQNLFKFLREYNVAGQIQTWRPSTGAFPIKIISPDGSPPAPDDGRAVEKTASTRLWLSPVDEGPVTVTGGFVSLTGNVWIYLQSERADQFYVAGGSAFSPPAVDPTKPYKIEASKLLIGAKKVSEGFTDIGVRPAFDAPPGFRERYRLFVLVRDEKFLTW